MKTGQIRKLVMVVSFSIGGMFMLSSCDKSNDNNNTGKNYTVSGNASGSQMVPTVTGSGSAIVPRGPLRVC